MKSHKSYKGMNFLLFYFTFVLLINLFLFFSKGYLEQLMENSANILFTKIIFVFDFLLLILVCLVIFTLFLKLKWGWQTILSYCVLVIMYYIIWIFHTFAHLSYYVQNQQMNFILSTNAFMLMEVVLTAVMLIIYSVIFSYVYKRREYFRY